MKVIDVLLIRLPWFEQYGSPLIIHVYKIDKEKRHFNWFSIIWVFILFQPNGSREYTHLHVRIISSSLLNFHSKDSSSFFLKTYPMIHQIGMLAWNYYFKSLGVGGFLRFGIIDPLDQLDLTWRVMDGFNWDGWLKSNLTIRDYRIFVWVLTCFNINHLKIQLNRYLYP